MAKSYNYSFRNIDDVLSLNNGRFMDYVHLIHPNEMEIKTQTDNALLKLIVRYKIRATKVFMLPSRD